MPLGPAPQGGEVDAKVNPIDAKYAQLATELKHVKPSSKEHKVVQQYITATKSGYRDVKLLEMWTVTPMAAAGQRQEEKGLVSQLH